MPDTTNEKDDVLDDGLVRRKPTFEELKTYKANQLRLFVRKFGFKTSVEKDELLASAQACVLMDLEEKPSPAEEEEQNQ